jgi:hypothetical protein
MLNNMNHEMTRNGTKQLLVLFRVISWFRFAAFLFMRLLLGERVEARREDETFHLPFITFLASTFSGGNLPDKLSRRIIRIKPG